MTVWKTILKLDDVTETTLPKGAKLLTTAGRGARVCVWALVDPTQPKVSRRFRIAGTGHPIEATDAERYVGTVFMGALVFHVFDLGE